tara:strand:- start:476 stop:1402 length:927 start_codon:yes stop_codon:yes gene_type:complete
MQNIDECDAGLWATPNTMDHLPPRSEEGTIKLMEGQRKGRTKPANLREQVDNKTMDMYKQTSSTLWPTPTTQEIEHPQVELTPNNRRLSKDGKSSHSLNLADSVKMWRTPTAANAKQGPKSKELYEKVKKDGSSAITLVDEVKMFPTPRVREEIMWPTPTTKGYGHASMGQTMIFRKKVEAGEMTEQQAEQMLGCTLRPPRMEKWNYPKREMFPTPTARDYKDSGNMENWKENRQRMSLPRKVYWENKKKEMFPTPSANEDAAGRPGGKMQKMLGNHPSVRDQSPGTLNPTWVEWLMGYPTGYTDLDV